MTATNTSGEVREYVAENPDLLADGGTTQRETAFDRVREHEDAVAEIGAGNAPDAHVARVLLALAQDEQPNPDDLDRLCRTENSDRKTGR